MRNIDLREPENRKEAFIYWCKWSLENKDCDPALWLLNYLFERFEHNLEQKYWISWIYGTTYHLPTAWIIWNEFPDFELVNLDRLTEWNDDNYKRLRYQTDTKYNKGYLPQQFESYRKWIYHNNENGDQRTRFNMFNEKNSFDFLWTTINKNLYKFGRYSTWYYMQTLHKCVGVDLEPNNLMLEDYTGSRSHRNGLCYALAKDDWVDKKLHKSCIEYMNHEAYSIKQELKHKHNIDMNYYEMETLLCSFKKIFRKSRGRYLGYYLDRQAEEIKKVEADDWIGIDWEVFWNGREETLQKPLYESKNIRDNLYSIFLDTGTFDYKTL